LPGVRQLQTWIRLKSAINVQLVDGVQLDGTLLWQDGEFLALQHPQDNEPILIARHAVAVIRALG
jgi:host factor-I protein